MPLTLVTGPANAAKAGVVLSAFREALDRATSAHGLARRARHRLTPAPAPDPLLVVPTAADIEPYQRELAASGTVFGGEVTTFRRLLSLIAREAGHPGRPLGRVARERVVRAVVADAKPRVLAASAATPGFATAVGRLFSELQAARVGPERFAGAMRTWAARTDPSRSAYAAEVAGLYSAYRARLEALGRVDEDGHAWDVLDALRADPSRWSGRPVFLYGFDDLTPAQLDTVETLVRACGAPVTVSLTYEPGRAVFADRSRTVEVLRPLAEADGEVRVLPERAEHYAPAARPALHHLERRLFEGTDERVTPNGAVRLLEAGGERAEAELIGAALLELVRQDADPADVAVLVRTPEQAPLLAQVLEGYGLPVERQERVPLARTRLGAGVLAFGRAALPGATAADVLTWLRTPGKLADPARADRLERTVRRQGLRSARQALRAWGEVPPELEAAMAAVAAAQDPQDEGAGIGAFLDLLEDELQAIWTAPYARQAAVLGPDAHADARVAGEVRHACRELRQLAADDPALVGGAPDVLEALASVRVRQGGASGTGVLLTDPMSVRARRFRAVVVCGLQDQEFPRAPLAEPFLDDADRRSLARETGVVLPLHEDVLAFERFLLYSATSRASEVLFLSFRSSDEEGEPELRSPFVDDVRDLFTEDLWAGRGRRLLAEVTWPAAQAPTPLELRRARAVATGGGTEAPLSPPSAGPVLAALAAREVESARGLEAFAACGVRWLVERVLRPERIDPDPDPMVRGSLAHAVLERTLRGLRARAGSARLSPQSLPAARDELRAAMAELASSRAGAPARAALRALEADLLRWLEEECLNGPALEPSFLEWSFGGEADEHGTYDLGPIRVSGRVDRIDVGPAGEALVRDYKNSKGFPQATWAADGHLQAALYALAARDLLGLSPAGAVYQPLRGRDLRPRGAAVAGEAATGLVDKDVVAPEQWEALLDVVKASAGDAARRLRAGEITSCPERCTTRGCAYPGICRAPEKAPVVP